MICEAWHSIQVPNLICISMNQIYQIILFIRPFWNFITKSLLVSILIMLLSIPGPYITKLMIDNVYPNKDFTLLHFVLILAAVFSISTVLIQSLSNYFNQNINIRISYDFESRFYNHIQSLDFSFFDKRETGEIISRFQDMQSSIFSVISIINTIIMNCLQLIIFPLILFYINWQLALISLIVLPFDTILAYFTSKYYRDLSKKIAERSAEMTAKTYESLAGIRTVQALGIERTFYRMIFGLFRTIAHLNIKLSTVQNSSAFLSGTFKALGNMAYGWYGWTQILQGNLTLGSFMAFSGYVGYLYGPLENLIGLLPRLETTKVHTTRFFEIYDLKPEIQDRSDLPILHKVQGHIGFHGVHFSYDTNTHDNVLHDINLEIFPHTMVALVGRSGSGKSTLAKLVPRFYDPIEGYVSIDGEDIRQFRLKSLRQQVGFTMQGSILFQGNIMENLTCGRDISRQDIEYAARTAYIHEFLMSLPEGYQTEVGEQGIQLSEGQKQRIALARVLLLNTPILILDEPTSALDLESEAYIHKALKTVRQDRTVIMIAHRLSTIQSADIIVVLDNVRIVEQGTHEELLIRGGIYVQLYDRMASI